MSFDPGSEDRRERARRLVERAGHDSVTEAILLGTGRFSNEFYLYDKPLLAHFDDGEQPHFAFYNEMKGVGVDGKRNNRTPDEGGIAVVALTDRRVLAVIGRRSADERLTVPYEVVTDASYSTGILKNRIAIETVETTYHLWIDSGYDERALAEAVDFVVGEMTGGESTAAGTDPGAVTGDGGERDGTATGGRSTGGGVGADETGGPTSRSAGDEAGAADGDGDGDEDPLDRLERLQELRERGAITESEFEEKKRDLMDRI